MKNRFLIILSVSILVLIFGGGLLSARVWYRNSLKPTSASTEKAILIRIELGMSSADVAKELEQQDLIRNQIAFRWYVFTQGISTKLQAGLYQLHGGLSAPEIAKIISTGATETVSVTITPGMRLNQVIGLFEQAGFSKAEIKAALSRSYPYSVLKDKPAKASLEGYLFADTYRIEIDRPLAELIELIIFNTDSKITLEIREAWANLGLNIHQGLTLSSIVQKEVANERDQKQVAQVFLKRLKIGMRLEADPTFEYAANLLGKPPSIHLDSPYNTYRYKGLPPTPISAIDGMAAEAVAYPADTDWLYFLSDKNGVTHFTKTQAEHNQNIDRYLR